MNDRELLELAAKAAEIKTIAWGVQFDRVGWFCNPTGEHWNPMEDDGEALRLAVTLGICIGPNFDNDKAVADGGEFSQHHCVELFASDKFAATRRAIVRAAAEIGKETK